MDTGRKPLQGVGNIIRFNVHFYIIAAAVLLCLFVCASWLPPAWQPLLSLGLVLATASILVSLLVSCYVYDFSDLYQLPWLNIRDGDVILNVNAGFDETSQIIAQKAANTQLVVCDFYDPKRHTEISIKRARRANPPQPNTQAVHTAALPFPNGSFDVTLAILSAHEIRDTSERVQFFREIKRVTKPIGRVFVTEHLRDPFNFMAYTIGFLHFHSHSTWLQTFEKANLQVEQTIKTTPFITTFVLKHGDPN